MNDLLVLWKYDVKGTAGEGFREVKNMSSGIRDKEILVL